jgi:hypothetical protein
MSNEKGEIPSPKAYGFIKVTASKFTNLKVLTMSKSCLQSNNLLFIAAKQHCNKSEEGSGKTVKNLQHCNKLKR